MYRYRPNRIILGASKHVLDSRQGFHSLRPLLIAGEDISVTSHTSNISNRSNGRCNTTKWQQMRSFSSSKNDRLRRIVVGITGATGTVYALRILSLLRQYEIETHLVISKWALATMKYETSLSEAQIREMASKTYTAKDLSAHIASGSFQHDGMIIVPCSMKTLAAIRSGFCDDLISRAADVTLKENRKLVLAVRETPLNDIHLDNMLFLRKAGAVIFPPVPAFYTRPRDLDDIIDQTAGRMLDSLGIFTHGFPRWEGFQRTPAADVDRIGQ